MEPVRFVLVHDLTLPFALPCVFHHRSSAPPISDLNIPRYKVVLQSVIGEVKGQGAYIASRCLWDTETDNYSSFSMKNVRNSSSSAAGGDAAASGTAHMRHHPHTPIMLGGTYCLFSPPCSAC